MPRQNNVLGISSGKLDEVPVEVSVRMKLEAVAQVSVEPRLPEERKVDHGCSVVIPAPVTVSVEASVGVWPRDVRLRQLVKKRVGSWAELGVDIGGESASLVVQQRSRPCGGVPTSWAGP